MKIDARIPTKLATEITFGTDHESFFVKHTWIEVLCADRKLYWLKLICGINTRKEGGSWGGTEWSLL